MGSERKYIPKAFSILLGFFPLILFLFPFLWLLSPASEIDLREITSLPQSERTSRVILKSLKYSLFVGLLSLVYATVIHALIQQSRFRRFALLLFSVPLFLSPYTFVQGWIHWLGDEGLLSTLSTNKTIYSETGLLFMLSAHLFPWALILLQLGHRPLARNEKEFSQMIPLHCWQRFRLLIWPRIGLPLAVAFLWICLQAFWAYDIPSMLRQNLVALELMAAFGSFYELNRALSVLLQTWPVILFPSLLVILIFLQKEHLKRLLEFEVRPTIKCSWKDLISLTLSSLLILIPLTGLIAQITSLPQPGQIFQNAFGDFKNTLIYALASPLLSILFLSPLLFTQGKGQSFLLSFFILGLSIPSSVLGILWLQVSTQTWWPLIIQGKPLMVLLLAIFLLPFTALGFVVFLHAPSKAWSDFRKMTPNKHHLQRLELFHLLRPSLGKVALLLSFIVIREVPLILLHYPPEGGTLALTIETMLHFDQPSLVAGLSLFQIGATALVATTFGFLSLSPR